MGMKYWAAFLVLSVVLLASFAQADECTDTDDEECEGALSPGQPQADPIGSGDPCRDYIVLNDPWRSIEHTRTRNRSNYIVRCDRRILSPDMKWYRFIGPGGHRLPDTCTNIWSCSTNAPGWLYGGHPDIVGQTLTRKVCFHWSNNCCRWSTYIQVKRCPGDYFVYFLKPHRACSLTHCTTDQDIGNSLLYECNFGTNSSREWCSLRQSNEDNFNWQLHLGATKSFFTGPSAGKTTGSAVDMYIYTEASSPRVSGDRASFELPITIDVRSCLMFWYHMHGAQMGRLSVSMIPRDGQGVELWRLAGNQGNEWKKAEITINPGGERHVLRFTGVIGDGYHGDMAIDNIVLLTGVCPVQKFECGFELKSFCGLINLNSGDNFDWQLGEGDTPTRDTGPEHGLRDSGEVLDVYAYAESTSRKHGDVARLQFPFAVSSKSCLHFWYNMHGNQMGSLKVMAISTQGHHSQLWARHGDQGTKWHQVNVTVYRQTEITLEFVAIVGGYRSDIAIDDIRVSQGGCVVSHYDCNFGNHSGEMCGIEQAEDDEFDWQLNSGPTLSLGTGPKAGHTDGTVDDFYIYAEGSGKQTGETARLHLPFIVAEDACLSFFYHMHGLKMATLSVMKYNSQEDAHPSVVWFRSGEQGVGWQEAKITFHHGELIMLEYRKSVGSSYHSDIAVDDLVLYPGKCQVTSYFCDFGNGDKGSFCGIAQDELGDQDDWKLHNGKTPSWETGPLYGHTTGEISDWYIYTEGSVRADDDVARLRLPFEVSNTACLSFWFHMRGNSFGTLSVISVLDENDGKILFTVSGEQSSIWKYAQVTVNSGEVLELDFNGKHRSGPKSDLAVDDIRLEPGECKFSVFTCDFGTSPHEKWCGIEQMEGSDEFDWVLNTGSTPSVGTGPQSGHTTGLADDVYVYAELEGTIDGWAAGLVLPAVFTETSCFEFNYHMHGTVDKYVGDLKIFARERGSEKQTELWVLSGGQGNAWKKGYVTVPVQKHKSVQIEILMIDAGSTFGDIALDDLNVFPGACPEFPHFRCDFGTAPTPPSHIYNDNDPVYAPLPSGAPTPSVKGFRIRREGPNDFMKFPWRDPKDKIPAVDGFQTCGIDMSMKRDDDSVITPARGSFTGSLYFYGPRGGHTTGNPNDFYIHLRATKKNHIERLILPFKVSALSCLSFWVHTFLTKPQQVGLIVHIAGREPQVFDLHGDDQLKTTWQEVQIEIPPVNNREITAEFRESATLTQLGIEVYSAILEGNLNKQEDAQRLHVDSFDEILRRNLTIERLPPPDNSLAIDDIELYRGPCTVWQCNFGYGKEGAQTCGFKQDDDDDEYDWKIGRGNEDLADTGPKEGHTRGDPNDNYLYIQSYDPSIIDLPSEDIDRRKRSVEPLTAKLFFPIYLASDSCFTFWFHMHGPDIGSLSLFIYRKGFEETTKHLIWQKTGDQGDRWQRAQINLSPLRAVKFYFQAVQKEGIGMEGEIAVDDLMITPGHCNVDTCGVDDRCQCWLLSGATCRESGEPCMCKPRASAQGWRDHIGKEFVFSLLYPETVFLQKHLRRKRQILIDAKFNAYPLESQILCLSPNPCTVSISNTINAPPLEVLTISPGKSRRVQFHAIIAENMLGITRGNILGDCKFGVFCFFIYFMYYSGHIKPLRGLIVTSDQDISIEAYAPFPTGSLTSTLLLPTDALDTEYIVDLRDYSKEQFVVVTGVYASTTVSIHLPPKEKCRSENFNPSMDVLLRSKPCAVYIIDELFVYEYISVNNFENGNRRKKRFIKISKIERLVTPYEPGDVITFSFGRATTKVIFTGETFGLSGSYIKANKPVAVFTGAFTEDAYPLYGSTSQLMPISTFGKSFVLPRASPMDESRGDFHLVSKIIAAEQNTSVTIRDNGQTETLTIPKRGDLLSQHHYFADTFNVTIVTDKAAQVSLQSVINREVNGSGFSYIPPYEQWSFQYWFAPKQFTRNSKYELQEIFIVYDATEVSNDYPIWVSYDGGETRHEPFDFDDFGHHHRHIDGNFYQISVLVQDLRANMTDYDDYIMIAQSDPTVRFLVMILHHGAAKSITASFTTLGVRATRIYEKCQTSLPVYGDLLDNDCDGRIDEELANFQDDDGDGYIDEDLAERRSDWYFSPPIKIICTSTHFSRTMSVIYDDGEVLNRVYANGKEGTCSFNHRYATEYSRDVDLISAGHECNITLTTERTSLIYTMDLIARRHPLVVHGNDQRYTVSCTFDIANKTVAHTAYQISLMPPTPPIAPIPRANPLQEKDAGYDGFIGSSSLLTGAAKIYLDVVSGVTKSKITKMKVGQHIRLRATLEPSGPYQGIRVTECKVHESLRKLRTIGFTDKYGCGDGVILEKEAGFEPLDVDRPYIAYTKEFKAFKFEGFSTIYFECKVEICAGLEPCHEDHCDYKEDNEMDLFMPEPYAAEFPWVSDNIPSGFGDGIPGIRKREAIKLTEKLSVERLEKRDTGEQFVENKDELFDDSTNTATTLSKTEQAAVTISTPPTERLEKGDTGELFVESKDGLLKHGTRKPPDSRVSTPEPTTGTRATNPTKESTTVKVSTSPTVESIKTTMTSPIEDDHWNDDYIPRDPELGARFHTSESKKSSNEKLTKATVSQENKQSGGSVNSAINGMGTEDLDLDKQSSNNRGTKTNVPKPEINKLMISSLIVVEDDVAENTTEISHNGNIHNPNPTSKEPPCDLYSIEVISVASLLGVLLVVSIVIVASMLARLREIRKTRSNLVQMKLAKKMHAPGPNRAYTLSLSSGKTSVHDSAGRNSSQDDSTLNSSTKKTNKGLVR